MNSLMNRWPAAPRILESAGWYALAFILTQILHEAAHALAHARNIQDTSRQGRYHNKKYKALAEEVGLNCEQMGNIGWSKTSLRKVTVAAYAGALQELGAGIADSHRRLPGWIRPAGDAESDADTDGDQAGGDEGEDKKKGGRPLYVCGCPEPRKMRMSPGVFELGPITCGLCGQAFAEAEP